jgi:1-deoxy-D-xylulose-5-phosphate reductoisomerase
MTQKTNVRRLIVLGSTGSIGVNTLQVVQHLNDTAEHNGHARFEVVGLAAGRKADALIEQARRFNVKSVAVADADQAADVRRQLPGVTVFAGADSALDLVESLDATDCVSAVVGSAGLPATMAAVRKSMTIGLANKETLVAAGEIVNPLIKKHRATLIPVDSEHSAIFQCIAGQLHLEPGQSPEASIKRIVLTASGGPFRTTDKATMRKATVEQALKHPTWKMGQKITIDSASMMNKSLEIIEAHWLFDLPAERIDVIIHPQSIAHSFVEFTDHSILAQLGSPDMKTPIQYALTYPARPHGCSDPLDWSKLSRLEFEQPDHDRFPGMKLAYHVIRAGGTSGAIFNAANEAAVAAFLDRRIAFGQIFDLVAQALDSLPIEPLKDLGAALEADARARSFVNEQVGAAVR